MTNDKPSNLRAKLSAAQLFKLGMLCEDHEEEMTNGMPITEENCGEVSRRMVEVQAPIARLMFDAGVTCKDFGKWGYDNYHPAFMLASIVGHPDSFPAGSGGHEILIAAGIRSTDPTTWPADEDDTEYEGEGIA